MMRFDSVWMLMTLKHQQLMGCFWGFCLVEFLRHITGLVSMLNDWK